MMQVAREMEDLFSTVEASPKGGLLSALQLRMNKNSNKLEFLTKRGLSLLGR